MGEALSSVISCAIWGAQTCNCAMLAMELQERSDEVRMLVIPLSLNYLANKSNSECRMYLAVLVAELHSKRIVLFVCVRIHCSAR